GRNDVANETLHLAFPGGDVLHPKGRAEPFKRNVAGDRTQERRLGLPSSDVSTNARKASVSGDPDAQLDMRRMFLKQNARRDRRARNDGMSRTPNDFADPNQIVAGPSRDFIPQSAIS